MITHTTDAEHIHNLTSEGECQHAGRTLCANATRAQVEQRFLIQLTDCRAVCAFHVVGEDLKPRVGMRQSAFTQNKVAVLLHSVGFLRTLKHLDQTIEHGLRTTLQNAFEALTTKAILHSVIKPSMEIDELLAIGEINAVAVNLTALAL